HQGQVENQAQGRRGHRELKHLFCLCVLGASVVKRTSIYATRSPREHLPDSKKGKGGKSGIEII
ncbi:MAG: hypothetical protein KDK78_10935, partial [Chlamydiia bacterium]|nr:hypothetical protein [Chlamydiia bacterium]